MAFPNSMLPPQTADRVRHAARDWGFGVDHVLSAEMNGMRIEGGFNRPFHHHQAAWSESAWGSDFGKRSFIFVVCGSGRAPSERTEVAKGGGHQYVLFPSGLGGLGLGFVTQLWPEVANYPAGGRGAVFGALRRSGLADLATSAFKRCPA